MKKNQKVKKVILFGSRAKGNFNEGSDIDIAIAGTDLNLDDLLEAMNEFDQLSLPYKIDLIIHDRIGEEDLIGHMNRVVITLFER